MATQLTQVVEQMSRANENLSTLASKNTPVADIAHLWREAYANSRHLPTMSGETADSSNAEREHSSLSVIDRDNRL
jgi:hypothetical protein